MVKPADMWDIQVLLQATAANTRRGKCGRKVLSCALGPVIPPDSRCYALLISYYY